MTCVLSMTALYNNPCSRFSEGSAGIGQVCEEFGYRWVAPSHGGLGGGEAHQAPTTCRGEVGSPTPHGKLPLGPESASSTLTGGVFGDQNETMCNISRESGSDKGPVKAGVKRKLNCCDSLEVDECISYVPPKRISPFLNTPKERKEERKKILKISIQKLRKLDDPEHFLRRSVLINNTMKKMQTELRAEKQNYPRGQYSTYNMYRFRPHCGYDVLNNSCLSNSYLFDDPFLSGENEKITDDNTDTLMHSIEDRLGGSIGNLPNDNSSKDLKVSANVSAPERLCAETGEMCDIQADLYSIASSKPVVTAHSNLANTDVELKFDHSVLNDSLRDSSSNKSVEAVFNNLIRALGET